MTILCEGLFFPLPGMWAVIFVEVNKDQPNEKSKAYLFITIKV